MSLSDEYVAQTHRLRRMALESENRQRPTATPAPFISPASQNCPTCNKRLIELPRARVFMHRLDGQRYRCQHCKQKHLLFLGELLPI
jgi:uncharacterized protein with PIN domain